jgi:hypothetical protein
MTGEGFFLLPPSVDREGDIGGPPAISGAGIRTRKSVNLAGEFLPWHSAIYTLPAFFLCICTMQQEEN